MEDKIKDSHSGSASDNVNKIWDLILKTQGKRPARFTKIKVIKSAGVNDTSPLIEAAGALEICREEVLRVRVIKNVRDGRDQKDENKTIIATKAPQKSMGLREYKELHAGSKDEKISINMNKTQVLPN